MCGFDVEIVVNGAKIQENTLTWRQYWKMITFTSTIAPGQNIGGDIPPPPAPGMYAGVVGRVVLCNWSPAYPVKYRQSTIHAALSLTLTPCNLMQCGLGFHGGLAFLTQRCQTRICLHTF